MMAWPSVNGKALASPQLVIRDRRVTRRRMRLIMMFVLPFDFRCVYGPKQPIG
jgi:hypothetical protein